jgi:hypothetical protein
MPFNTARYVNDQMSITQKISDLENSRPQLPSETAEDLVMQVKLLKSEAGNEYPIIEMKDGSGSITITNSNHLDVINFIKEIFQ